MSTNNEYSDRRLYLQIKSFIQRVYHYRNKRSFNSLLLSDEAIEAAIELEYKIPINKLRTKCRLRKLVEPRQVWATMLYMNGGMTLNEIGIMIGNFDHATVLYCIRQVKAMYQTDRAYQKRLNRILNELDFSPDQMNF